MRTAVLAMVVGTALGLQESCCCTFAARKMKLCCVGYAVRLLVLYGDWFCTATVLFRLSSFGVHGHVRSILGCWLGVDRGGGRSIVWVLTKLRKSTEPKLNWGNVQAIRASVRWLNGKFRAERCRTSIRLCSKTGQT